MDANRIKRSWVLRALVLPTLVVGVAGAVARADAGARPQPQRPLAERIADVRSGIAQALRAGNSQTLEALSYGTMREGSYEPDQIATWWSWYDTWHSWLNYFNWFNSPWVT